MGQEPTALLVIPGIGFRVWGLGFRVYGLGGLGVCGLGALGFHFGGRGAGVYN